MGGDPFPTSLHVPQEWADAAEAIRREGIRKVAVLGGVDMGKSTLCRFLLDHAARSGRSAALLDTDIGQKTVGPPACVTLCDRHGLSLAFVGTTSPVAGWRPLIEGTRRLAHRADGDLLVVNTSGLLSGPGRRLKAAKIGVLEPELLMLLGNGSDLDDIVSDHPDLPVLRLPSSPEARRKTGGERRRIRREAFRRYFRESAKVSAGRELFQGAGPDPLPKGLLLGLADIHGCDLGLGLLLEEVLDSKIIEILTPVTNDIRRATPGALCLDENFSESHIRTPKPNS